VLIEMAFKEMLADKKFQGITQNSLTNYENLWSVFSKFLEKEGIERVDQLNPLVYKKFLREYTEKGNKPSSINTKLKLLRAFSRWMYEEGITEDLTCKNIKYVRNDATPKIVRDEDIKKALSYLRRKRRREDSFYAMRNHTILVTLIGTGLRVTELISLDWDDIDFKDNLITLRKTKSRKLSSVPMSETVAKELTSYRLYVERHFPEVPRAVFITTKGERLTRNGVRLFFNRLKKDCGIEGDFSPHAMRNVFIKNLLKNKANLREAQLLARHSKIEVTKQYVGYFQHELKEAIDEHDPLKGLL
jgi:integrase/recombinase XerD